MKKQFLIVTALITLYSCGNSPLLNHDKADNLKNNQIAVADENCPLSYPDVDGRDLCAKIFWIVGPSRPNENSFTLKFWDKEIGSADSGPYVDPGHDVFVLPWMVMDNGHEHGTSPVTISEDDVGIYNVTRLFFIMAGRWQIHVQLKDGDTVVKSAMQHVDIR